MKFNKTIMQENVKIEFDYEHDAECIDILDGLCCELIELLAQLGCEEEILNLNDSSDYYLGENFKVEIEN